MEDNLSKDRSMFLLILGSVLALAAVTVVRNWNKAPRAVPSAATPTAPATAAAAPVSPPQPNWLKRNWKPLIAVPILAAIIWFVGVPAVRWATSPSHEWKQSVRERAGGKQQTMVRVVMKRDLVATAKGTERIPLDPAFCTHIESLEAVPFIIHFSSRGKVDSLMMPAEGNGPPLPYPTEWVKLAARGKDSVNVVVMQTIKGN